MFSSGEINRRNSGREKNINQVSAGAYHDALLPRATTSVRLIGVSSAMRQVHQSLSPS